MQEQYAIPKHKFEAEVDFCDGDSLNLTLFLSEGAASHMGPERPSDVLNGLVCFLPAIDSHGNLMLVNINMIRIARVAESSEFVPGSEEDGYSAGTSTSQLSIVMENGTTLEGFVTYTLPRAHSRLQDYLNSESRFLVVRGEGVTRYVNRRFVSRVIPDNSHGAQGRQS